MNKFLAVAVVSILCGNTALVWACTPCKQDYDLSASLAEADFIILVEKLRDGTATDSGHGWGGPDWIEVAIKGSLKGRRLPPRIKVNSYDGQCVYGFDLDKGREYVLLLKEIDESKKQYRFDSVFRGCGVKALEVEDDYIIINGARWTVEEFESLIY